LLADGEQGAECYSAATMRNQARIVFDTARNMVRKEPLLRDRFQVDLTAHLMSVDATSSKFEPLSSDEKSLEGLNIHCGVIDELHAHRTRNVYDVMETASGSRRQPLIWVITTAGSNRSGVCYEVRSYVTKLLDQVTENESFFGIIYTIDEDDPWEERSTWEKANPNLNISVFPRSISALCKKARTMASAQPSFMTKHLNVWVSAGHQWMDMFAWQKAAEPQLDETDFEGEVCYQGIDLASKLDPLNGTSLSP
jgi:phage terminase large subunit-like protein